MEKVRERNENSKYVTIGNRRPSLVAKRKGKF